MLAYATSYHMAQLFTPGDVLRKTVLERFQITQDTMAEAMGVSRSAPPVDEARRCRPRGGLQRWLCRWLVGQGSTADRTVGRGQHHMADVLRSG